MELKYFKKGSTENGYGEEGFVFDQIVSIRKENRVITIMEECDGYFKKEMSPEAAVELFEEAIRIIKDMSL